MLATPLRHLGSFPRCITGNGSIVSVTSIGKVARDAGSLYTPQHKMFATRLACLRSVPTLVRPALIQPSPALRNTTIKTHQWSSQPNQGYSTKTRFGIRRAKTAREEIKEAAFEPSMGTAARFFETCGLSILSMLLQHFLPEGYRHTIRFTYDHDQRYDLAVIVVDATGRLIVAGSAVVGLGSTVLLWIGDV
ncbi:unnamed protein product [Ranitomeya imitator]|uniref:Uncharacterized protein n=1 Tax=Ranitomeya imitator TaxID=111125 RepID=A0ABN9LRV2_9NEOB|nr:unnamed protein product [Ranitomeya imitator]